MSIEALNYARTLKVGNPTRKLVLMLLADRADEQFSCFPSVPLLAAEVEISERMIQNHLRDLRRDGLISDRIRRRSDRTQASNRYYLHGPWDDFGGTNHPFPRIETPRDMRSRRWEEQPLDAEFRSGTVAAHKTAGGKQGELSFTLSDLRDETGFVSDGGTVKPASPSTVKSTSPSTVKPASPLEPSGTDPQEKNPHLSLPYPSHDGAGSDADPEGSDERDAATPSNPAGAGSTESLWDNGADPFPDEVTEVVVNAAIEAGVDPGEALDVLYTWDRLSFRYFGERGTLEELLDEGPVVVEQLSLGRSALEIEGQLEGDFRQAAEDAA